MLRQVRLSALADAPHAFASTLERELDRDEAAWRAWLATTACFAAVPQAGAGEACGLVVTGRDKEAGGVAGQVWGLYAMWVAPAVRGRGVAGRLVCAAAGHASAAGAVRLRLWAADGNGRARAFYLREGFQPTGLRQRYRREDGTELDEEMFAMELPASG